MGDLDCDAVVRLFSDLEALRRALRLYPPSHPALEPARARLRARGAALSPAATASLTVSFAAGHLFWAGEEVPLPATVPAARVVELLSNVAISALRLSFPQAADGLPVLADRLAELSEAPGEADRSRLLAGPAPPGIELVPIDLSGLQLLDADDARAAGGSRQVWSELAQRLARDGAFSIAALVNSGDLTPGAAAAMAASVGDPETLFDHLFAHLEEIARDPAQGRRPFALAELRAFFAELLRLLDPERRLLAVAAGLRHLPLADPDDPWVASELLLDAVERMLQQGLPIPAVVQRALRHLAAPTRHELPATPEAIAARARGLLARVPVLPPSTPAGPEGESTQPAGALADGTGARELVEALAGSEPRRHVVRILLEAMTLWPNSPVAELAATRLVEDFVAALNAGDIETATRLAPLVGASRSAGSRRMIAIEGVPAAVRAFRTVAKSRHAELTATLAALGEAAIPAILDALVEEENLAVRKRLLQVVSRQGTAAVPYLKPLLDDSRWYVVRNAVFLLRRAAAADVVNALKTRVDGVHPKVLAEILKALVSVQDPEWFVTLMRSVDDPDPGRSVAAIEVASRIRHPDVAAALASRLRARTGARLREASTVALIRAVGHLGEAVALAPLRRILGIRQWLSPVSLREVRREAAAAIALIDAAQTGQEAALARGRQVEATEAAQPALRRDALDSEDDP